MTPEARFESAAIRSAVFQVFLECVRGEFVPGKLFDVVNPNAKLARNSLFGLVLERVYADALPEHLQDIENVLWEEFTQLVHRGLVLPPWACTGNCKFIPTERAILAFGSGALIPSSEGLVGKRISQLREEFPESIDPATELVAQEASDCLHSGCYRACVVLIGLAAEHTAERLFSASLGVGGYERTACRSLLSDEGQNFSKRWNALMTILASFREHGKKQKDGRPEWYALLEGIPNSLAAIGEALRLARNSAAHSPDRTFTYLEAAHLLTSLPVQLAAMAQLTRFLSSPEAQVYLAKQ